MRKWFVSLLMLVPAFAGTAMGDFNSMTQSIQGAESDVKGSVSDVNQHAQNVFKQLGIQQTGSSVQDSGAQQTLAGKKGEMNVQVELKQTSDNQTHVGVVAKQGKFKWNKDFAQNVLSKIIQSG